MSSPGVCSIFNKLTIHSSFLVLDIITETLTQDCLTPDTGSYGGGDTFPKSFYDSLPVSTISSPRNYESAVSEDGECIMKGSYLYYGLTEF